MGKKWVVQVIFFGLPCGIEEFDDEESANQYALEFEGSRFAGFTSLPVVSCRIIES